MGATDISTCVAPNQILSRTVQKIYDLSQKLFNANSDDISAEFKDFIQKEKKLLSVPLAPVEWNKINSIFHNSAGIWFYQEVGVLKEFIEKLKKNIKSLQEKETSKEEDEDMEEEGDDMEKDSEDKIKEKELISFFELLNEKHNFAVARALGLIGKLIAVQFWIVLEDDDIQIDARYNTFLKKIEHWAKDSSKFMKGQERLFEDVPVSYDAVYVSLVKDNESTDALTKDLLELIFTAFVPFAKKILQGYFSCAKRNGESTMEVPIHEDFIFSDGIFKNINAITPIAFNALMSYTKTRNGANQDTLSNKDNANFHEGFQIVIPRKIIQKL